MQSKTCWKLVKTIEAWWLVGRQSQIFISNDFLLQVMAPKPPISSTLLGTFHQTSLTWILSQISTRFQKKQTLHYPPFSQAPVKSVKSVDLPPKCAPDPRTFSNKIRLPSLKLTCSHLKIGLFPKRKQSSSNHPFAGATPLKNDGWNVGRWFLSF